MCLVISVLLAALGINFYLNGFYMQAGLMAVLAAGFALLMFKNISCRKNECNIKKKDKSDKNEEGQA